MTRRWDKAGAAFALVLGLGSVAVAQDVAKLRSDFMSPPKDARPMVRWWWFGPSVTKQELGHEIDQMHEGGFGGYEMTSVYPMALDDATKGIKNLRYTSPEMVEMLRFAQEHGRQLGMRVDLTLGSGWPYGGPHIDINHAAARLKMVAVSFNAQSPALAEGEHVIAAYSAKGTPEKWDTGSAHRVSVKGDVAAFGGTAGDVKVYFILSHTKQAVKRAAVGGEGYVVDHMSKEAIDLHLKSVADPLLNAFAGAPPYAVFSDSLEVYGSDWTPTLPEEFLKRRGYDILDHLPEIWQGTTPQADAIRHDWGVTLSDLVRENYLRTMANYASSHGTKFRSQTYGEPAVTFADERVPQLPEGEGPQWKAFSFTRWTSSANHIFGNKVTSSETWTWLHSPAFRATPLDMKAEADRHFLEGVNQLVAHGWSYSAPSVEEPGWALYAAAVFNAHNPWWPVMPEVTKYLQRVSWLMRQGEPANDVAVLLPEDDAQADFRPGHVSVTVEMQKLITPALMSSIVNAGYNLDYIDAEAIALKGLHHKVLVVPPTHRMPLKTAQQLQQYVKAGGKIIFVGDEPSMAPGLQDASQSVDVAKTIGALNAATEHVVDTAALPAALHTVLAPDLNVSDGKGSVGFVHRKLTNADVYFVANTSPMPQVVKAAPRARHNELELWSPDSGLATVAVYGASITLAPYESVVLVAHDGAALHEREKKLGPSAGSPIALTQWKAEFPGSAGSKALPAANVTDTVWSDNAATKFYSGEVRYSTSFTARAIAKGEHVMLKFADGKPLEDTSDASKPGMRAWYDAPVREAAIVMVNGKRAGALWHPPYELDLSSVVKAGENTVEIRVFNTAINELAGQPRRDYSALKAKYGDRFQPQDMDNLQPVTSGIVGPVQVEYRR